MKSSRSSERSPAAATLDLSTSHHHHHREREKERERGEREREREKRTPEVTPEKLSSKSPAAAKHKSPKALMDVIKELKSNKQKSKGRSSSSSLLGIDTGKSSTNTSPNKSSPDKNSAEGSTKEAGET